MWLRWPSRNLFNKCHKSLALPLHILCTKSFKIGKVPKLQKRSLIIPALKPDSNRADPASYRPLSMTSHIVKIFEKVIKNFVQSHLEQNDLLSKFQHGFCKNKSCLSQLLIFNNEIMKIIENGENADILYLDFSKAFD